MSSSQWQWQSSSSYSLADPPPPDLSLPLHYSWHLIERFVLQGRSSPLKPLWERFVLDFLLPELQHYLAKAAAGQVRNVGQEQRAMYQRGCIMSPFDFTDEWVSKHRARMLCSLLEKVRAALAKKGRVCTMWWATDPKEMVKVVKAEHEASQARLGAVGPSSRTGSSSGATNIKEDPDAARSAASSVQSDLVKDPSNNKRKADDISSTTTTTEPPTASSIEGGGSKIKRERTA